MNCSQPWCLSPACAAWRSSTDVDALKPPMPKALLALVLAHYCIECTVHVLVDEERSVRANGATIFWMLATRIRQPARCFWEWLLIWTARRDRCVQSVFSSMSHFRIPP